MQGVDRAAVGAVDICVAVEGRVMAVIFWDFLLDLFL